MENMAEKEKKKKIPFLFPNFTTKNKGRTQKSSLLFPPSYVPFQFNSGLDKKPT